MMLELRRLFVAPVSNILDATWIKSTLCRTCFKFIGCDFETVFALGLNLTTAAYKKQTNNRVFGFVFKH